MKMTMKKSAAKSAKNVKAKSGKKPQKPKTHTPREGKGFCCAGEFAEERDVWGARSLRCQFVNRAFLRAKGKPLTPPMIFAMDGGSEFNQNAIAAQVRELRERNLIEKSGDGYVATKRALKFKAEGIADKRVTLAS